MPVRKRPGAVAKTRASIGASNDEEMMRLVAELYYVRQESQAAIAELTGFSVSKISRLLAQAREHGVVRISIQPARHVLTELAARLATALGIEVAHVTPGRGDDPTAASRLCAVAAAPWIAETIPASGVLGIAGGYTASVLVDALPAANHSHLTIVPLVGGWDPATPHLDINALTRRAAQRLGCRYLLLHAPARLDSSEIKNALLRESTIRATTDYWSKISVGLIGVGGGPDAHPGYTTVMDRLSSADRRQMMKLGVVGDIVGYLLTIDGELVENPLTAHTIAAPVESLRLASRLIAVAAGPHKVDSIIGAARSGLLHALATDEPTAAAILERLASSR